MRFSNISAASAVVALANSSALISRATSGEATFYGGNVSGGTCSFVGYTIPPGLFGLAMTDSSWDGAKTCGACVEVTGPAGNKITAMVVDQCPGCGVGHLDLFADAFAKLADPAKGIIPVSWDYVSCPISSPIQVRNKEGTSPYWFSMQVINASKRVEKLEFSSNGGASWTSTERKFYNYFEYPAGSGTSSVDVKITSVDGDVVIVKGVGIGSGVTATAGGNFGSGGSQATEPEPVAPAPVAPVVEPTTPIAVVKPAAAPTPALEVVQPNPTTVRAVFQESSVVYAPVQSTTLATLTSKLAAASLTTTPPSTTSISSKTKSTSTEPAVVVVTVTINSCPAPSSTSTIL